VADAVDFPNGTAVTTTDLVDAIVYHTGQGNDAGLLTLLNASEPQVNENDRSDSSSHSLQRIPNGIGGYRNTSRYVAEVPTPKGANTILSIITVEGNATEIDDGDTTPDAADHTLFEGAAVNGETSTRTYTIRNSGLATLTINNVRITGTNSSDFSVTASPAATVASNGSTTFTVTFDPSGADTRNATIEIDNNDADRNPYNFDIQGEGLMPDMVISGNGSDIVNGDASPSTVDHTDFGAADTAVGSVTRTFTITNNGPLSLHLSESSPYVTLSGTHASDFSVTTAPSPTVASGGDTTTFDITFDPSGTGVHRATISISSDDLDDSPYTFAIQGTGGSYPEISVEGNSVEIVDGDGTPSTADGTDFGYDLYLYLAYSPEHEFTIRNTGSAPLNLTDTPRVTLTGTDFTLTQDGPASIGPGGTGTFKIRFAATATVVRTGTVSIANDDNGENPYNFAIRGEGYSGPLMIVQGGSPSQDIENGDTTPSTDDATDFGTTNVAGGIVEHTFEIENFGSSDLGLGGTPRVEITGDPSGDFLVSQQPGATISPGGNAICKILFNPNASGLRTATVSIDNDDPDSNPYTFAIQGTGQSVPTVTTTEPSSIMQTTAVSGGDVTADGNAPVTARGVCWSTSSNPTIADSHTIDGTGTGAFTSTMTGLTPNTTYDVRAYATNSVGTAYGGAWTFTTKPTGVAPNMLLLFDEEEEAPRRR